MRAYLLLGANLGDTQQTFDAVPAALRARAIDVTGESRRFVTKPSGGPERQPDFLNQALEVTTTCTPQELLEAANAIERAFGRDRSIEQRNGPRTLDIDILAIEGVTLDEPALTVPHPRLHERAFALIPLAELAPGFELPGRGTVASLLVGLGEDASTVRPVR